MVNPPFSKCCGHAGSHANGGPVRDRCTPGGINRHHRLSYPSGKKMGELLKIIAVFDFSLKVKVKFPEEWAFLPIT